jgi:putative oxidoreductase
MQNGLQNPAALVGRLLLAILFIKYGFEKVTGFEGTVGYIASKGLPMPAVLAALATLVELGGGILVAIGLFTRWAALAISGFCVLTAILFHPFWAAPAASQMGDQISFFKDLAIAGGMLMLVAFGPGALSVDARRSVA